MFLRLTQPIKAIQMINLHLTMVNFKSKEISNPSVKYKLKLEMRNIKKIFKWTVAKTWKKSTKKAPKF